MRKIYQRVLKLSVAVVIEMKKKYAKWICSARGYFNGVKVPGTNQPMMDLLFRVADVVDTQMSESS